MAQRGLAPANTTSRVIKLSTVAGCELGTPKNPNALQAGLGSQCVLTGALAADETLTVTFDVPKKASASGSFDLVVQLRTVDGVTKLGLVTPERGYDDMPNFMGRSLYSTISSSEEFIALPGEYMEENPGAYKLLVANAMDRSSFFQLRVQTPLSSNKLAEEDAAVMRDVLATCCINATDSEFCNYLPTALSPSHAATDDLCRLAPITCDNEGHLVQFVLPGASLDCQGQGLPPSFAKLTTLTMLDLAYNDIGGPVTAMAAVLANMPSLTRAFLRGTGIAGTLDCGLVNNPSLLVLSVTGNQQLSGTVPGCFLSDPTLEELYMSDTGLEGELPDVVPETSPLRSLFIINTGDPGAPALVGTIPRSLANAANLTYLDLSSNKLEGVIPPLPSALVVLNVSANQLTSLPSPMPPRLEMLDASFNSLAGTIPDIGRSLFILNLEDNQLTGPLPGFEARADMSGGLGGRRRRAARRLQQAGVDDVSDGSDPQGSAAGPQGADDPRDLAAPDLRVVYLGLNRLSGPLPDEWAITPRYLQVLDVGKNDLGGSLPSSWDLPRLAILNVGENLFEGQLPPAVGTLPGLIFLDANSNNFGGDLAAFASAVSTNGSERLMHIDLSDGRQGQGAARPDARQWPPWHVGRRCVRG